MQFGDSSLKRSEGQYEFDVYWWNGASVEKLCTRCIRVQLDSSLFQAFSRIV